MDEGRELSARDASGNGQSRPTTEGGVWGSYVAYLNGLEATRSFVAFALDVLAIGGNGEGWTINDAVSALRVALGEDGVNESWHTALSDDDRARLRAFVGKDRLDAE